ncbi:hypothetical protein ACFSE0_21985 [Ochrobactrum teleogrylli]|uniref:Uncharacterized protein n=1 Tax=Ochrobactrum teleogrylli TaxID=2479765 RepID=A0ABY2Y337_9HYPH|nr:hypothetical protein [[Ochrobactrum] teleogrylli]TNV15021.1 hypothetical protein FIC94_12780 [[Ochrobactrum] teleogrylli]
MSKSALLQSTPIASKGNLAAAAPIPSNDGKAFFGQDRVSVLTKSVAILPVMKSFYTICANYCERPAL